MTIWNILDATGENYKVIANCSSGTVNALTLDSRTATTDAIFTAIKGFQMDGHKFIQSAFDQGCRNFIVEDKSFITEKLKEQANVALVGNIRRVFGSVARQLENCPDTKLHMFGITGTKGKTTVTTLLHHIVESVFPTSLFTTVAYKIAEIAGDSERTTMEANLLQKYLHYGVDAGETHACVEVSSHAVTLSRVENIEWDTGIFTSFSRDHLDLYGSMECYFEAKLDFFRALNRSSKPNKKAFINMDDPKGCDVLSIIDSTVTPFKISTTDSSADYYVSKWYYNNAQMVLDIKTPAGQMSFRVRLYGEVNVTNCALAIATSLERGISSEQVQQALDSFSGVVGRFEMVLENPFMAMVDYAHTPDSLKKLLQEARKLSRGKVILVFGCTGNRDQEKRPIMGGIACNLADRVFITNDDTYTENPEAIVAMIIEGVISSNYQVVYDRKEAIRLALSEATAGDIVLLAGMGHEKVQILPERKVPHNDREEVLKWAECNIENGALV